MSSLEYSLIFLAIVISYVVTVVMSGWGKQIKYYEPGKFSFPLLAWTIILFVYLLHVWLWTYSYHLGFLENFFWFTLFLFRPLLIYFCLEVLTPDNPEIVDFAVYFDQKRKKFFLMLAVMWLYEIALILIMRSNLSTPRAAMAYVGLASSVSLVYVINRRFLQVTTSVVLLIMLMFFVMQVMGW